MGFKGGKVFVKIVVSHLEFLQFILGPFAFCVIREGFFESLLKFLPGIGLAWDHAGIFYDMAKPSISCIDPSFALGSFKE